MFKVADKGITSVVEKKRYLLFDSGCSECTEIAHSVEQETEGWLTMRSLHEPEVQELLSQARPDWKWEPTLLEIDEGKTLVFTGLAMKTRMLMGLGPRRLARLGKITHLKNTAKLERMFTFPEKDSNHLAEEHMDRRTALKAIGVFGLAVASLSFSPSIAHAQNTSATVREADLAREAAKSRTFDKAVSLMEQHMQVTDSGTLSLNSKGLALAIKNTANKEIDTTIFGELKRSLARTNIGLKSGRLKASEVFPSRNTPISTSAKGTSAAFAGCPGTNSVHTHWYGYHIFLNECRTHDLIVLLQAGGSAAAIRSFFGRLIPLAIAGVIGNFYGSFLNWVCGKGGHRGIVLKITWSGTVASLWHQ